MSIETPEERDDRLVEELVDSIEPVIRCLIRTENFIDSSTPLSEEALAELTAFEQKELKKLKLPDLIIEFAHIVQVHTLLHIKLKEGLEPVQN